MLLYIRIFYMYYNTLYVFSLYLYILFFLKFSNYFKNSTFLLYIYFFLHFCLVYIYEFEYIIIKQKPISFFHFFCLLGVGGVVGAGLKEQL